VGQEPAPPAEESSLKILPPSLGETVSTERPFATPAELEPLPVSPELALNSADLVQEPAGEPVHTNGTHPVTGEVSEHESVHHD
jgi:hypothetical protein